MPRDFTVRPTVNGVNVALENEAIGSFSYKFNDALTSSPASGYVHFDAELLSETTVMYINHDDANASDLSNFFNSIESIGSGSFLKGYVVVKKKSDPSKYFIGSFSDLVVGGSVTSFAFYGTSFSDNTPFTDEDEIVIDFFFGGDRGSSGPFGGALTIPYKFSTTTTGADPGNGFLRLNNATQSSANLIYADLLSTGYPTPFAGYDVTDMLDSIPLVASNILGNIRLVKADDPTKWIFFRVFEVSSPSGYRNISVAVIDSSSSNPFANNDILLLHYAPAGDAGSTYGTAPFYYDNTTDTVSVIPDGYFRLDQEDVATVTELKMSAIDINLADWLGLFGSITSESSVKAFISMKERQNPENFVVFAITDVISDGRWAVVPVAFSESEPFDFEDVIDVDFYLSGDKGDNGLSGGLSLRYQFSNTTTDSDPGDGFMRLNNATQNLSTVIRLDEKENIGAVLRDVAGIINTWDDSTSTIKGYIRIISEVDPSQWAVFSLSSIASPSGYKNLNVTNMAASATNPFTSGEFVIVTFTPKGDKGDTGATGSGDLSSTLFDANTILAANADDTPLALTMGASTILARLAAGNIKAATPAELRTLLSLVIGTDVQAYDADLGAIAALTSAADKLPYSTGAQAWALTDLSTFMRTLLDDADAAAARATLGVPALTSAKSIVTQPAIANTETVIISYTCAANELAVGTTFWFKAYFTKAGTQSAAATIRIRVGTTTLTGNIAATLTPPNNALAVPGEIEGIVTVVTNGAGGTIRGSLKQQVHLAAVTIQPAIASTAAVAVNTTTANMLIELTFISGHATNTYTFQNVLLQKIVA